MLSDTLASGHLTSCNDSFVLSAHIVTTRIGLAFGDTSISQAVALAGGVCPGWWVGDGGGGGHDGIQASIDSKSNVLL